MAIRELRSLEVGGRRVLMRVDYNVPLAAGAVADDTRIRASLPTLEYLRGKGARIVLMSHLGRPKGMRKPEFGLAPVARRLGELLGEEVALAPDCIGPEVEAQAAALAPGRVLLLENLRFHPEEEKNDPLFAAALARLGDVYVNDAFGTAHRAHASTTGVPAILAEKAPGFLMERELRYLGSLLVAPGRPFVVLLGGAKVSGKITVIESLLPRLDTLIIGGAMMFTFWRAQGRETGRSLVEEDQIATAETVLRRAAELNREIVLPIDCVAATDLECATGARVAAAADLRADEIGADIGPASRERFLARLSGARTIFWNGPMGVFEREPFAAGTLAMAQGLAAAGERGATTVVGGGDSVAALNRMGLADRISHVSTGGGASLEFLEGRPLPGVVALEG
jgi:phosphoglycerate kinase